MSTEPDPVRQVTQAVLYEGYLLWPYRRSALKNQQRWTFGGVYPHPYSAKRDGDDPSMMQTQCLLESDGDRGVPAGGTVNVRVRFLQVIQREVARETGDGLETVSELTVKRHRYLAWEESIEREVVATGLDVEQLSEAAHRVEIDIPGDEHTEWLADDSEQTVGALLRSWQAIRGTVDIRAERRSVCCFNLTVTINNTTPWEGTERERALKRTMVSTHTVLSVDGARWVSLLDPPEKLHGLAQACRPHNIGTWPVLIGAEDERHTMLSSPIILYDYPQVAPESPGDLFDATEIDQLLTLNVLALTEDEQREARDIDPRARQIIDRSNAMSADDLMGLHGTMRDIRPITAEGGEHD